MGHPGAQGLLVLLLQVLVIPVVSVGGSNSSDQGNITSGGFNLTVIPPLNHDNFTVVNATDNNTTTLSTLSNNASSNATAAPPFVANTSISDVTAKYDDATTEYDNVTESFNVTWCRSGHGYPEFCPGPSDPVTYTKCCRYYKEPRCCEERARKLCANRNRGLDYVSGFDLDPEPDMLAIFCPMPGQSDDYTSCGYTKEDMTCFSRVTAQILVWVTAAVIFFLAPLAFGLFTCYEMRKERKKNQELLAAGIFSRVEIEVVKGKVIKRTEVIPTGKKFWDKNKEKDDSASVGDTAKQRKTSGISLKSMRREGSDVEQNDTVQQVKGNTTSFTESIETKADDKSNHNNIKQRKKNSALLKSNGKEHAKEKKPSKGGKKNESMANHNGSSQKIKESVDDGGTVTRRRKNSAANHSNDIEIIRSNSHTSLEDSNIAKSSQC